LYTRSAILFKLSKFVNGAKKQKQPLSLIVVKIDNYSTYEEEFDILLSEELLKETAQVIKTVIQENYVAGRYGEAIFLILLENTEIEEAYDIAETIRKIMFNTFFIPHRYVSVSAGVDLYKSEETIGEFLKKTIEKLTSAQKNGGNQTVI